MTNKPSVLFMSHLDEVLVALGSAFVEYICKFIMHQCKLMMDNKNVQYSKLYNHKNDIVDNGGLYLWK